MWTHQDCLWLGSVRVRRLSWVIGVHCGATRGVEGIASWGVCAPLWEADSRRPTTTYFKLFVMYTMTVNSHGGVIWGRVKLYLAEMSTSFLWSKSMKCLKLGNLVKKLVKTVHFLLFLSSIALSFVCVCVCVCVYFRVPRFPGLVDLIDILHSFAGSQNVVGVLTASVQIQMFPPCPHAGPQWQEHNPR